MSDSDTDISMPETPPELKAHDTSISYLIPQKSKTKYETSYQHFKEWCFKKNKNTVSEKVLLAYIVEKSKTLKSSSLWSIYSRLKCMLNIKEGLDVASYSKVLPFLKKISRGYKAEKTKVLTQEQINTFLEQADDKQYLLLKVILIMGISGALKRTELAKITLDDIEEWNGQLIVTVFDTKTEDNRTFTITNPDYVRLYRKYVTLRPTHVKSRRLFLKYFEGRFYAKVVGINTIGKIPSLIANYLKLPNSNQYTGHCFRSSSGTILANKRASTSVDNSQCNIIGLMNNEHKIMNNFLYNCRLCLKSPQDTPFKLLSTINLAYIRLILPEIDLTIVEAPQICTDCLNSLENAYNFKTKCLETETQIKRIIENNKNNKNSVRDEDMNEKVNCFINDREPATNHYESQSFCSTSLSGQLQTEDIPERIKITYNVKTKCLKKGTEVQSFTEYNNIKEEVDVEDYEISFPTYNFNIVNDMNSIKDEDMNEEVNCPIDEKKEMKHSNLKPLICSQSVLQSEHFPERIKNEFKCSFCSINFNLESELNNHIMCHTNEKPFSDYEVVDVQVVHNK